MIPTDQDAHELLRLAGTSPFSWTLNEARWAVRAIKDICQDWQRLKDEIHVLRRVHKDALIKVANYQNEQDAMNFGVREEVERANGADKRVKELTDVLQQICDMAYGEVKASCALQKKSSSTCTQLPVTEDGGVAQVG